MIIAGNRVYFQCPTCGKLVRQKTFFGTLHVCASDEEIAVAAQMRQAQMQQDNLTKHWLNMLGLK